MSGKKSFDEGKVLRAALNVFRQKGFAGAGLAELEEATAGDLDLTEVVGAEPDVVLFARRLLLDERIDDLDDRGDFGEVVLFAEAAGDGQEGEEEERSESVHGHDQFEE